VKKATGFYPCPDVDGAGTQVVSQAGALLLTGTIATVGLDRALSTALQAWQAWLAVHDPAKVLLDLALGLAVGGDCLADVAVLRAEPGVFGLVASDSDGVAHDRPARRRLQIGSWPRLTPRGPRPARGCGTWPGTRLPATARTPPGRR